MSFDISSYLKVFVTSVTSLKICLISNSSSDDSFISLKIQILSKGPPQCWGISVFLSSSTFLQIIFTCFLCGKLFQGRQISGKHQSSYHSSVCVCFLSQADLFSSFCSSCFPYELFLQVNLDFF